MNVIAIDPGVTGGIVFYQNGNIRIYDTPRNKGKKKGVDIDALRHIFWTELHNNSFKYVGVIEQVHSMPHDGSVSAFGFGKTFGIQSTFLHCFCAEVVEIPPTVWKRHLQLLKAPKKASLEMARELFPEQQSDLAFAKDHNRAEALLLLYYYIITRKEHERNDQIKADSDS